MRTIFDASMGQKTIRDLITMLVLGAMPYSVILFIALQTDGKTL
jgi:hypothetical protein